MVAPLLTVAVGFTSTVTVLAVPVHDPIFCFNETPTTEIYALPLHGALPILPVPLPVLGVIPATAARVHVKVAPLVALVGV